MKKSEESFNKNFEAAKKYIDENSKGVNFSDKK
jgi:hypothetical protein